MIPQVPLYLEFYIMKLVTVHLQSLIIWLLFYGSVFYSSLISHIRSRADVQTCTYWGAPIIWDGMFDIDLYDEKHKTNQSFVALTVFAVGRLVSPIIT